MSNLENLTDFPATLIPSLSLDGEDIFLAIASARFDLSDPCRGGGVPQPSPDQPPLRMVDEYFGEPDRSSLRYDGQPVPARRGTDVMLLGHACAPGGKPIGRVDVGLAIGTRVRKTVAVFGERVWEEGLRLRATPPRPFHRMPLRWERAFGGAEPVEANPSFEPRNPVGRGYYCTRDQALYQPLPNLEDPQDLIRSYTDRPRPAAFGPIARSWQPRLSYAGSYDARWVEQRAPDWPEDLDPRFFQAAPPDLVASPFLVGGEPVVLRGISPLGDHRFQLPRYRLLLKSYLERGSRRRLLRLDTVLFEPDERVLTMTWRVAVQVPRGHSKHRVSVLRFLEPWEDAPS